VCSKEFSSLNAKSSMTTNLLISQHKV
jgi:hypothetical protein